MDEAQLCHQQYLLLQPLLACCNPSSVIALSPRVFLTTVGRANSSMRSISTEEVEPPPLGACGAGGADGAWLRREKPLALLQGKCPSTTLVPRKKVGKPEVGCCGVAKGAESRSIVERDKPTVSSATMQEREVGTDAEGREGRSREERVAGRQVRLHVCPSLPLEEG